MEEFRILGHSMCLKRRRGDRKDSVSSSSIVAVAATKRVMVDSSLESRRFEHR